MKRILTSAALAAAALSAQAAGTTLANGDFAFTGVNVNTSVGGWSFVTFVDLAAGTTIYFTDTNVLQATPAAGVFSTTAEGFWSWTASSAVAAGTSVALRGSGTNNGQYTAKSGEAGGTANGTVIALNGTNGTNISSGGDILYAFQAASFATNYQPSAITFLGAISNRAAYTTSDNAVAATGLGGIQVRTFRGSGDTRYTQFTAQTTTADTPYASMAELKLALADGSNWTTIASSTSTPIVADVLAVAAPVPEPETYALMLAGIAVVGGVARRRGLRR
ncbi:MAG TPA: PEP-CTERM sorting domain-containing protein [Roseateles sp.]